MSEVQTRRLCRRLDQAGYQGVLHTTYSSERIHVRGRRTSRQRCVFPSQKLPSTEQEGKAKQTTKVAPFNSRKTSLNGSAFDVPTRWKALVKRLERPASSPIEAFLLPEDDPRIVRTRASFQDVVSKRSTVDWARCEVRHRDARFAEDIGEKRPLTLWTEGGGCSLPDFAWNDWAVTQPERVLDLMDISLLRYAVKGVDASFKTIVWNLSQNVDRIGYPKGGLSPCMTPTMIPYISNRGGPMTGYEALGMQGLPVDRLLLTRETEDNCMDLAGNAMSTTVVGACVLSALVLAASALKRAYVLPEQDGVHSLTSTETGLSRFVGEDRLVRSEIDLAEIEEFSIARLLDHADRSRRLCECEGRTSQTNLPIVQCRDCGSTACSRCQGRPEHNYPRLSNGDVDLQAFTIERMDPKLFEKEFKRAVPMRLAFASTSVSVLEKFAHIKESLSISNRRWTAWKDGCRNALSEELRFRSIKRQEVWSAIWDSEFAILNLVLDPIQPEWRLFARPNPELEASSDIRALFSQPIARLSLDTKQGSSLLNGIWDVCLPSINTFEVTLTGGEEGISENGTGIAEHGDLVPSWEMSLGLLADQYKAKRVWKYLDVKTSTKSGHILDRPIDGRYHLIDKCGCASNSLHKLENRHMYLFLDPKRCTTADADYFVFSVSQRRFVYGETRPVAAKLHPRWRQFGQDLSQGKILKTSKTSCVVEGTWMAAANLTLDTSKLQKAVVRLPEASKFFEIDVSQGSCTTADALLTCKLPLSVAEPAWTSHWTEVDHVHERQIFGAVSWLTERLRGICGLDEWMSLKYLPSTDHDEHCQRCAPTPPEVFFGEVFKAKSKNAKCKTRIQGMEDIGEAGRFEQGLKNRPQLFATQLRLVNGIAELRIGLNIASMIHRALARLPRGFNTANFSWRLDTNYIEQQRLILPSFKRALEQNSNRNEPEAAQPPHFRIPLRLEQLRSLTWMLDQEKASAKPWDEQEIVEALLAPLNWRAEGRASRALDIRGGVLADEVGYGKTAITLGLIDSSPDRRKAPTDEDGLISTRATLIVVPGHLIKQWPSEILKFLGKDIKVISIENVNQLKKYAILDYLQADIVCVSGTILKNKSYLAQLGALAGGVYLPDKSDKGGRYFDQKHAEAMKGLRTTVQDLKQNDVSKVWREIKEGRPEDIKSRKAIFIQTKRMKGRAFREQEAPDRHTKLTSDHVEEADHVRSTARPVPLPEARGNKQASVELKRQRNINQTGFRKKKSCFRIIYSSEDESEQDNDVDESRCTSSSCDVSDTAREFGNPRQFTPAETSDDLESDGEAFAPFSKLKRHTFEVQIRSGVSREATNLSKTTNRDSSEATSTSKALSDVEEQAFASTLSESCRASDAYQPMDINRLSEDSLDEEVNLTAEDTDIITRFKIDRGTEVNQAIKNDPWGLATRSVQRDYRQMKSPVLEMFKFNRFVIDEYTYLKDKLHKMTMNMKSERRWILSGTPPLEDFMAMKTISVFLGVSLGINDIPPSLKARKSWFNEFTAVEKFHSFRETKSFAWHTERHRQAERFLKQFMRQNKPEIDEIPATEIHHNVVLPAAERAIYLELLHHLQALDMNIKRSKKGVSDREKRITESFGESQTAEEALIKRCAHFDYSTVHDSEDNAIYECDRLVETRTRQLRDCEMQLHDTLWNLFQEEQQDSASKASQSVGLFNKESIFRTWLTHLQNKGTTDGDGTARIRRIIETCSEATHSSTREKPVLSEYETDAARRQRLHYNTKKTAPTSRLDPAVSGATINRKNHRAAKEDMLDIADAYESLESSSEFEQSEDSDDVRRHRKKLRVHKTKSMRVDSDEESIGNEAGAQDKLISKQPDWADVKRRLFKDKSHMLKRIEKELVGRVKSLRFFEVVRDVQRLNSTTIRLEDKPRLTFHCPGPNCRHRRSDGERIALDLKDVCVCSTCGHVGCHGCLKEFAKDQRCPEPGCLSPSILNVIVKSTSLGEEEDIKNEMVAGKHWGTKIEQICQLIQNEIPEDEKIILFCQFKDLTETVDKALHDKGIGRIRLTGSSSAKSKALGRFQDPKATERVLVLQADDESASGANLTVANHVIFVSPLLADSPGQYQAQETQAIGRVKRFGQKKHVYIHRFLTLDTIDVEIFEKREEEKIFDQGQDLEAY